MYLSMPGVHRQCNMEMFYMLIFHKNIFDRDGLINNNPTKIKYVTANLFTTFYLLIL